MRFLSELNSLLICFRWSSVETVQKERWM